MILSKLGSRGWDHAFDIGFILFYFESLSITAVIIKKTLQSSIFYFYDHLSNCLNVTFLFRKASSVLAAHPVKITSGKEAKKLVCMIFFV